MNPYIKILIVAFIILIISYIKEHYTDNELSDNKLSLFNYIHIYVFRYIHYCIFLMMSFYLIFFWGCGRKVDMYLYLLLVLIVLLGWEIFNCCVLSYIELLYYNIDTENINIRIHPFIYLIFGRSVNGPGHFSRFFGILFMIINVSVILYNLKSIKLIYRIIYVILLLTLILREFNKDERYYSIENKGLFYIKNIHIYYTKNILNL